MVRLKGPRDIKGQWVSDNFNSNMVRLKGYRARLRRCRRSYFNSNMVRLKEEAPDLRTVEPFGISIPIWCD